ncbi:uncharacterized protein LOC125832867 [Solanum verrucosum]|uniref:uncharacterized protein LOC125832867 n=1 Tax=Solanum verrucosum TaxID=315347 RepID=UPI0020D07064|nr:uncharacterized protein LOC125832867 [Solanum verrucosum]
MKKGTLFEWDQACSNAFESIKSYLTKLPVLAAPVLGKPLILYILAQERSVGALLAQENGKGTENSLYYLSRMMTPNELKYSPIEKLCLAFVFSIQKMKHYFQAHVVRLISKSNPIKFVMSKLVLNDRLERWYLQFQQFEIVYVPQKAVKGQALADFLADHPIPDDWDPTNELPDEDAMVVEVQPPWKMYFDGASHRKGAGVGVIFVTSREEILLWLEDVTLQHVLRKRNKKDDALAVLASTLTLPDQAQITIYQKWIVPPDVDEKSKFEHLVAISQAKIVDWRHDLIDYLFYNILPEDPKRKTEIRRRAPRESSCVVWGKKKRFKLSKKHILEFVDHINLGPRLDVIGPLPKSSGGHLYISTAANYFSKWAEVVALKEVKKENVANFIRVNIIYRFGIPSYILTDNGNSFTNKLMDKICNLFGFKQRNSSMYYTSANGLAEAFNKTLCNLLKKVVSKSKRDWHDSMEEVLWAYRMTHRTPTQATLYSLVFGTEAVFPLERQIPLLRLAIQEGLTEEENVCLCLEELESLNDKRLEAQQSLECYQARLSRAFNKKVRLRSFQVGDQVLAVRRPIIISHKSKSKFTSKWDGPYAIQEVYSSGAYKIVDADGLRIGPINERFLKKYYP